MVDKTTPTPGSGTELPGQGTPPAGQAPAQPTQPAGGGPEFLTKAEFDAAMQRFQTSMGRKQADFAQRVQGDLTAFKQYIDFSRASGVQITPEQEQTMKSNVIARAFETPQEPPAHPAAQPNMPQFPGEQYEEPPDPVTAQAWQIMEDAGVLINDGDPEINLLDTSNEQAFIASVKPAIEAKIKRLAGGFQAQAAPHAPTNLGGGGMQSNDWQGKLHDPDEIWKGLTTS